MRLAVDLTFIMLVIALATMLAWRRPRVGIGLAIWLGALGALAAEGFFLDFTAMPPRLLMVLLLPLAIGLLLLPTHGTRHFLAVTPPELLVYAQVFRVIMELILWALALQGRAPSLITFEGRNIDVLVGLTAVPVGWMVVARHRWPVAVAQVWNVAGIVILANVVIHAQLSAPTAYQVFHTQPSSAFIGTFPYVWLPGFVVPLAFWLHAASLVQLARRPAPPSGPGAASR
ncbi:MAG TPA: hypothetical protein VGR82_17285 [Methylomirabilota bacterium]|nr:hypothetical protein [Methylomirabilota bacterium]